MAVIYISNGGIKAGILTDVGGRIVSFQRINGENVLESDPSLWDEPTEQRIIPTPHTLDFKAYNGHEVWVGPQSHWWKQQDLNEEKLSSALFWPPDPFISFGKYTILEQSEARIVLQSDISPISGIIITKEIKINEEGKLHFTATIQNKRSIAVSWDIWFVTRVNGHNPNFVPINSSEEVTLSEPSHPYQGRPRYKTEEGFFSFTPLDKDPNYEECTGKAFIRSNHPLIATVCGDELFVLQYTHHDAETIHPEQSEIELYNFVHEKREMSLLELEYHSPFKTLQPEEKMSSEMSWELIALNNIKEENEIKKILTTFANYEEN